jgi:23S rRNA (uracil1939-C5)-methyltransferase
MNRKMVNLAIDLLDLSASDSVLDGFCGIGNFSLAVARHAGRVIGAEQSPASIDRARENARQNGVNNATFEVVDLHAEDPEVPGFTGVNKVLLDPPRTGAHELVKTLASVNVSRVVYVSCNPETLARDVKILAENGFDLRSAGIIDMFPHTTHVESIALLVRRE